MESTPAPQATPGLPGRHLVAYCVGFVLLTNLLTVVFVFALRKAAPAPVILERVRPVATDAPEPGAHARGETRQVRVTSRPPGAVVTYQGQAQGTTPVSVTLPAQVAGALELAKEGYAARSVTVAPDQAEVHVRLVRDRQAGRRRRNPAPGDQAGAGQAGAGQAGDPASPAAPADPALSKDDGAGADAPANPGS